MARISLLLLLLLALGVMASLYASSAGSLSQSTNRIQINITDLGFEPDSVTILAGQCVHWTNESSPTHTVTVKGDHFNSGDLSTGAGFSIILAVPAFTPTSPYVILILKLEYE